MGERPQAPQHGRTATAAVLLALAGWMAGPAFAAPEPDLLCANERDATLVVTGAELSATPVNTSNELLGNHLLKPRVEATARKVFAEENAAEDERGSEDAAVDPPREPLSRSATDTQATPHRRPMYRRDI